MFKVTILLGAIFGVCTAAIIKSSEESEKIVDCKSATELWGAEDGTKFYFCVDTNETVEQKCDKNTFFVKNATVSGCVPFPAVAENCIYHSDLQPCKGPHILQPQTHLDPTRFYLCPTDGADPLELSCADGKAFLKQDGYMGCFEWADWRIIRGCPLAA